LQTCSLQTNAGHWLEFETQWPLEWAKLRRKIAGACCLDMEVGNHRAAS